ncbi:MAG: hypothetical protein JEZ14_26280, partial [Marinilabiliaceae bacterium]|nr:hypothetical protein [Marinilabiliaceae bacterium]
MSKRMYELVVITMLMMSFFCVPCQDVKACRTNSTASSMSDESLQQKINDLAGMSAIGYVPFWRVGLTKEG